MSKRRRNHSTAFKASVALEAIKGEQTCTGSEPFEHLGLKNKRDQLRFQVFLTPHLKQLIDCIDDNLSHDLTQHDIILLHK